MALNINRLKKSFGKIRSYDNLSKLEDIQKDSQDKKSFKIIPFELSLSYIDTAEVGKFGRETKISSLTQFKRVFTGTDNLIAKWEGAYTITRRSDKNLQKTLKVGRYFTGYIDTEIMGSSFESNSFDNNFLNWKNERTLTFITFEDLGDEDIYKIYVIPEIGGNAFWYIAPNGLRKQYSNDKKLVRVEVTLNKLNGELSKTGQALEQFIQTGAAGEGYAWPKVINGKVTLDGIKILDIPIQDIQKEYSGVAAISTLYAWGRPTRTKTINGVKFNAFNDIIEPPRLLLPYEMRTPEPSPLTTRGANETDFYIVKQAIPTYEQDFEHWKKYIETSQKDTLSLKNYEGFLSSIDTLAQIRETNPEVEGQPKYTIYNNGWRTDFKDQSYWNNASSIMSNTRLHFSLHTYLSITGIMAHNVFTTEHLLTLPMSLKNNIQWNLEDIPLIGGFLSKATLGLPIGWKNTSFRIANKPIALIIPKTIAEYTNQINSNSVLKIPLGYFGEDSNSLIQDVGINSISTNIKVTLTDRFYKTNNLGQTVIYPTSALTSKDPLHGQVTWNSTCQPAPPSGEGFVIDAVIDKAITKAKTRLTCYSGNLEVWQGSYNTKSLHTGNIRDWATIIKMSDWKISKPDGVAWPLVINPIDPNEFINAGISNTGGTKLENWSIDIDHLRGVSFSPYPEVINNPPVRYQDWAFTTNNIYDVPFPAGILSLADLQRQYKEIKIRINNIFYTIPLTEISSSRKVIKTENLDNTKYKKTYQFKRMRESDREHILIEGNKWYTYTPWTTTSPSRQYLTINSTSGVLQLGWWLNLDWAEYQEIENSTKPENLYRENPNYKTVIKNLIDVDIVQYVARE